MANYGPTGGRYPEQPSDPWYRDQNGRQDQQEDSSGHPSDDGRGRQGDRSLALPHQLPAIGDDWP